MLNILASSGRSGDHEFRFGTRIAFFTYEAWPLAVGLMRQLKEKVIEIRFQIDRDNKPSIIHIITQLTLLDNIFVNPFDFICLGIDGEVLPFFDFIFHEL